MRLIFPNQLFLEHTTAPADTTMLLIEDDLFFKQYKFHKQKLLLHRASIRHFKDLLESRGFRVIVVETSDRKSMDVVGEALSSLKPSAITYYELTDDWLQESLFKLFEELGVSAQRHESPGFLTSLGLIDDYFSNNPNRMQSFYAWQRKRLNILMTADNKPIGGAWSFDASNRKKLPKSIVLPPCYPTNTSDHVAEAMQWVDESFGGNPGTSQTFVYPVTHDQAMEQLERFLNERLADFGPYEDAIAESESELFHSILSPLINCGLLTPGQVVEATISYSKSHEAPIESLEGFIRQVIGWREYMRATYVHFGKEMRTANYLEAHQKLKHGWWTGSVGIKPIDVTIKRVLDTGYAHHIERLMILGNAMVLLRIDPDDVYRWFMEMFIDAYDWVMVPNVYAMSQFAAGTLITTKPYISGSNYIIKMSDYKKEPWSGVWDALYWKFIDDHREIIKQNFRMQMVVRIYDKFSSDKQQTIESTARQWLV
ncbi:cryptochrome/photolyase family protein [Aeromicrobium sp.]|nr:cryptochrome/photolyase family protein [Candidatus Saccharibacteria bacterium]